MSEALFSTVLELAKLGVVGFGIIVLLLSFFLLSKEPSIDPEKAKLINRFMTWGFVFGGVAAILGLVPLFIGSSGPLSVRLAFSPDFGTEKLRPPIIRLPDGTEAKHDTKFVLQPNPGTQVVTIAMDATLNEVRNLRQASANLSSTVFKVTKQRDALAATAAAVKETSEVAPNFPALKDLQTNSASFGVLQSEFARSLTMGDYVKANQLTGRFVSSVNSAEPAVALIASSKDEKAPQ